MDACTGGKSMKGCGGVSRMRGCGRRNIVLPIFQIATRGRGRKAASRSESTVTTGQGCAAPAGQTKGDGDRGMNPDADPFNRKAGTRPHAPDEIDLTCHNGVEGNARALWLDRDGFVNVLREGKVTHAEEILSAVSKMVRNDGKSTFRRKEIRDQIGVSQEEWDASYSPIFQGMRVDQPGGAPNPGARFKGVFWQVQHGEHALTDYGRQLVKEFEQ